MRGEKVVELSENVGRGSEGRKSRESERRGSMGSKGRESMGNDGSRRNRRIGG